MEPALPVELAHTTSRDSVENLSSRGGPEAERTDGSSLSDRVLLRICRFSEGDPQATPDQLFRLRLVLQLVGTEPYTSRLEPALALLASLLGQIKHFNPTHLPFGYSAPQLQSRDWIEQYVFERVAKQIVGLMWTSAGEGDVASAVEQAVSMCLRFGFLEQREYDAWRPGMRSGSGLRRMVSPTPYGVAKACAAAGHDAGIAVPDRCDVRCAPTEPRPAQAVPIGTPDHPREGTAPSEPLRPETLKPDADDPVLCGRPQVGASKPLDDRYAWARQIDLVRATNQVLGEGMLNKGVLSRACADGHVETNGATGRGARVRVRSFLTWVSRQNQLGADETNQIRNAVIGEISSRRS